MGASQSSIVKKFDVCEARALGTTNSGLFAYVLEGMPQGDYPSLGFPVTKSCDALLTAKKAGSEAMVDAAAKIVKSFFGSTSCIPYDVGGPANTPGDGPDPSAFGYQSCTECLHANSAHTLRNYSFSLKKSTDLCNRLYNNTVQPDLYALARQFGGAYDLAEGTAGVSHLIWSQGTLDPWHGWWKQIKTPAPNLEVYHILMEGSAHHTDLRLPSDADPHSVTLAREKEESILRRWIHEASSRPEVIV